MDLTLAGFFGGLSAEGIINFPDLKPDLRGKWHIKTAPHTLRKTRTTHVSVERDNE